MLDGVLYQRVARPALFRLGGGDAETAHERTLAGLAGLSRRPALLAAVRRRYAGDPPGLARTVFGVRFGNPVGLAAGMDKDGVALPAWPALGFGFVEVGTVTRHAQPGNPRPRLVRLPRSEAIVNRMGFNNAGAAALAARLAALGPLPVPLGVSLGKSRVTPLGDAVGDYVASLRLLHAHADYVAVNVSSPNTPGLRGLQDGAQLAELLAAMTAEARALAVGRPGTAGTGPPAGAAGAARPVGAVPLLVKIAPDLTDAAVGEVLQVCTDLGVSGVIATNTTLRRDGLAVADAARAAEAGGLSGRPLTERTREVVRFVHRETGGQLPVVGVGGVLDADDARQLFDAGASLVQLWTGLVYRGPALVREIIRALAHSGAVTAGEPPSVSTLGDSRTASSSRARRSRDRQGTGSGDGRP